ncbi:uncharacterized protein LOC108253828 [Diaphorina citri]|uniref:Uncharacterized protein LOC108253828 n=1 Tax=Diaphorina citri TaxID=121845 RepID=A0A1S4EP70_DIACI|nr:uncharacterized protein LOC108253828 [Diaphorina citri]
MINQQQHGFMKGKSTSTNLVSYTEFITSVIEDSGQVDCAYTDFAKCYDRINHNLLISKLRSFGIEGNLLNWIESFHVDRKQIVKISTSGKTGGSQHYKSKPISVTSGCIQGGHVSGILFLCFINDIIKIVPPQVKAWMFADDLKIAIRVRGESDALVLQETLRRLYCWCQNNLMQLNISKCKIMSYHTIRNPFIYNYHINNEQLGRVNQIKDLGVTFENNLKFNLHFSLTKSKALQMLGFLYRQTQDFRNSTTLKILYYAYVRSKVEYCSVVWSPQYKTHIKSLESIQHKFLRMLAYKQGSRILDHDYSHIMHVNKIVSLEHRREMNDLIFLHKLLNNKINVPELHHGINMRDNTMNTRLHSKFILKKSRTNIGEHSPMLRMQKFGNEISGAGVDVCSCSLTELRNFYLISK